MRNLVNRFWLMCCSTMLLITYMLCFGSAITFTNPSNVDGIISVSRNVVVEAATNDVKRDGVKETIKEDKKLELQSSVLLPLLPVFFNGLCLKKHNLEKVFYLNIPQPWNSAFIPSLGANAPPFARF